MSAIKKTGTFRGKSNALGYGGRAAQLKAQGVPGGVIGALARKAQAAPGQKNYHGGEDMPNDRMAAMDKIVRHRARMTTKMGKA